MGRTRIFYQPCRVEFSKHGGCTCVPRDSEHFCRLRTALTVCALQVHFSGHAGEEGMTHLFFQLDSHVVREYAPHEMVTSHLSR